MARQTPIMTITTSISIRVTPLMPRGSRMGLIYRPVGDLGDAAGGRGAGRQVGRIAEALLELPVTRRRIIVVSPRPTAQGGVARVEQRYQRAPIVHLDAGPGLQKAGEVFQTTAVIGIGAAGRGREAGN